MASGRLRVAGIMLCVAMALAAITCGIVGTEYEYEEELYLSLDGSATVNVNASVAALVALRGVDLAVSDARPDTQQIAALFSAPGVEVSRVRTSRRSGRWFVHVSIAAEDVERLHRLAPLSWSRYRFERQADVFEYQQIVGPPSGAAGEPAGWNGRELVAFRLHVPSQIPFHNSPGDIRRGNILEWEQPLQERLRGTPVDVRVQMEPESILYTTLFLFGATILAVALTFALVILWLLRRGRESELAGVS